MFTSQRVLTLLCGILLTGSVVFYFYKQNTSLQKPIKIYKTTSPQTQSPSSVTTPHEHTHNHTYNSSVHESPIHLSEMEDLRSNDIADSEVVGRDKDIRSLTNASEKTVSSVMEGISEEEATLWIQEQFEILGKQMMEKYPEIARVTELTPDEFHELYSTDEAKDAIRELALQAKNEFFADFRELLLLLPSDVSESVLDETRILVTKNWGEQMSDTIITQIRTELGM